MATFKVTMIFEEGKTGWTESWYWQPSVLSVLQTAPIQVGPPQPAQVPALANWYAAAQARVNMLPDVGILTAMRFADVDSPRSAFLDETVAMMAPTTGVPRDVRRRALVCTAQAGDALLYRRTANLRGIPDVFAEFNARGQSDTNTVNPLLQSYKVALISAGAAMRVLRKSGTTGPGAPIRIRSISFSPTFPNVIIETATPHGLTDGTPVRISKVLTVDSDTPPPVNGVFQVTTWDGGGADPATNFIIPFTWKTGYLNALYIGGGVVTPRSYVYPGLRTLKPDRWAQHRVGSPFGVGRGRSRGRRRRPSIPAVA